MPRIPKKKNAGKTRKEERNAARYAIEEEVRIKCDDWEQFRTEYSENVSETGIFIKTVHPLRPGTLFRLAIAVGDDQLDARARVVWTKEFHPEANRPSGMGAHFVDISPKSRKLIAQLLDQYETETNN